VTAMSPYDSLILAAEVELWGHPGGVPSVNPLCPGAIFSVMPGFDLNAPQPTTDYTGSLVTDGERPFGTRASNRTVTLPIKITAPTGDWSVLAGARELLLQLIDQPFFTLQWTRRQSPEDTQAFPMILDCFRANPSTIQYGGFDAHEINTVQLITVSFEALPYGHADIAQQIAFTSPVAAINAPPAPPSPVVLDNFATINSPQVSQSTVNVVGPYTAYWDPGAYPAYAPDGAGTPMTYSNTLGNVNLTGATAITFWLGLGSRYRFNLEHAGTTLVTANLTLTDSDGTLLPMTVRKRIPSSANPAIPVFTLFSLAIPQGVTSFNYAQVASYSLAVRNRAPRSGYAFGELRWTCAYLDALTAVPPSAIPVAPSVSGTIYTLNGVLGTVHAPAAFSFSQPPSAGSATTVTTVGPGTYTVPALTSYIKAEAIGGGGAGASQTGSGQGGGGGGAEYACEPLFACTPLQVIPYNIGAGGTSGASPASGGQTTFGGPTGTVVVANGAFSAAQNSAGSTAGATGSTNTLHYPGGAGRTASGSLGGGGGSSGGASSAGNTPVATSGAITLTGSGNWTCPAGVTQITSFGIGGGGGAGGGYYDGGTAYGGGGGGAGGGESATQTFTVVPGTSYAYVVGAGGAGGNYNGGSSTQGQPGTATTFTVAGVTMTAHGGLGGVTVVAGSGGTVGVPGYGVAGGSGSSGGGNGGTNYGAGGPAPTGGGYGGNASGPNAASAGQAGGFPGGGGGGSYTNPYAGGAGAAGTLILTYPVNAPTSNGGAAVTGGGAGGAGGGSANTAGTAGSQPGGGGGGANSTGTAEAGGAGGAGQLKITPYTPPPFSTLIVHRPSPVSPVQFNPLVNIGGVVPGTTEFPVQPLVAGIPARFSGTYTIILVADVLNAPSSARTISVSVKEYEYSGGTSTITTTTPVTITPSTPSLTGPGNQVNNGIIFAGVLTLPYKAIPEDNTQTYFTLLINDSNSADTFYDVLLCDSQGQLVCINEPTATYLQYFIDMPDPVYGIGQVLGSQAGRTEAVSVSDAAILSGGPLLLEPGRDILLCYSLPSAPSVSISYFPSYYLDRIF
jgi:hypothetical protein